MDGLGLRSAATLTDDALAQLFTEAYADYLVPVTVSAEALRFMAAAYDPDREASLVAVRDDELVGLVNLGLRGPEGWIGGLGVVPSERRRGTGRRARGVGRG